MRSAAGCVAYGIGSADNLRVTSLRSDLDRHLSPSTLSFLQGPRGQSPVGMVGVIGAARADHRRQGARDGSGRGRRGVRTGRTGWCEDVLSHGHCPSLTPPPPTPPNLPLPPSRVRSRGPRRRWSWPRARVTRTTSSQSPSWSCEGLGCAPRRGVGRCVSVAGVCQGVKVHWDAIHLRGAFQNLRHLCRLSTSESPGLGKLVSKILRREWTYGSRTLRKLGAQPLKGASAPSHPASS